ncbi:hypothetical protein FQ087_18200 [Sporosarcina sp. ANT_H38]|uniref:hypothetical protein n=1 Tax=Sporosarcina sp. ANT_H38 TaxID=2597358 RepID=UPI0011F1E9A8|nr:hypothetical protein [Sporosarcina sp. ANT_H38]KAA0944058.1 hypothetical protein FQ087_18200 [Sporosarcina sp. ANT_H38]
MGGLVRRKRLQDGTFGDFEKVFDGESSEEMVERLENESILLMEANLELYMENLAIRSEDLTNKEAILELYMMIGGM